jgi:hypothetical protein
VPVLVIFLVGLVLCSVVRYLVALWTRGDIIEFVSLPLSIGFRTSRMIDSILPHISFFLLAGLSSVSNS